MSSLVDRAQRVAQGARRRAVGDDERQVPRQRPVPDADEMRALLAVAFRPAGVTVVLLSALIVVTLVAANSDLTGTFGAIAASWLAIHQVPLTIDGTSLGVLPLIPTAGMMWVVARGCAAVVHPASSRRHALQVIGAAVAGPLVVTAIGLAVIADASAVIPLSSPNALAAFGWVLFVHLLASAIGVTVAMWPTLGAQVPSWVRDAVTAGTARVGGDSRCRRGHGHDLAADGVVDGRLAARTRRRRRRNARTDDPVDAVPAERRGGCRGRGDRRDRADRGRLGQRVRERRWCHCRRCRCSARSPTGCRVARWPALLVIPAADRCDARTRLRTPRRRAGQRCSPC